MQLTDNFTLEELTWSHTAHRRRIDNAPGPVEVENLKLLCRNVLQPLRDHLESPVVITSGFRCSVLCEALGSSPTSQHTFGWAADIQTPGVDLLEAAEWLIENTPFYGLILERPPGANPWIHVSYSEKDKLRGKIVFYDGSKYVDCTIEELKERWEA